MLAGELYDALDPDLVRDRDRARDLCQALNATRESEREIRRQILSHLFGKGGDTVWMQPPFFCDYGSNIELGERVFFNFNCVVLDVCPVRIGDFTLFGPGVQILTPMHPLNAELRRQQEFGKPISIGSDVWVGGAALILPGVRIGSRTVIGAAALLPGTYRTTCLRREIHAASSASSARRIARHHPMHRSGSAFSETERS
jgi:maltose O-acetyltransferase